MLVVAVDIFQRILLCFKCVGGGGGGGVEVRVEKALHEACRRLKRQQIGADCRLFLLLLAHTGICGSARVSHDAQAEEAV